MRYSWRLWCLLHLTLEFFASDGPSDRVRPTSMSYHSTFLQVLIWDSRLSVRWQKHDMAHGWWLRLLWFIDRLFWWWDMHRFRSLSQLSVPATTLLDVCLVQKLSLEIQSFKLLLVTLQAWIGRLVHDCAYVRGQSWGHSLSVLKVFVCLCG